MSRAGQPADNARPPAQGGAASTGSLVGLETRVLQHLGSASLAAKHTNHNSINMRVIITGKAPCQSRTTPSGSGKEARLTGPHRLGCGTGATGTAGAEAVRQALVDPAIEQVRGVVP